ncbi:MAG: histone deacetylase, partial [Thermoanaerobaculia bacterium]
MGVVTGVFYHPSFSRRSYLTVGARLTDFPSALDKLLESDKVELYEPEPVSGELLLKIHTPDLLERVGKDPLCSTAWHTAGGVVA